MNQALLKQIAKEAKGIRDKILKKQKPSMKFPLRNLSNVKFDPKAGYFQIGSKTKERTLAVSTVKTFAQSLKMIALSKKLIETDDIATKREATMWPRGGRRRCVSPSKQSRMRCSTMSRRSSR